MNKAIQKMMLALAVCGVMCTTAMAAPKGHARNNDRGRTQVTTVTRTTHTAPARHVDRTPAKTHVTTVKHVTHEVRNNVACHRAPAPVRHTPPPRQGCHHHHHDNDTGVVTFAATVVGGIVGGLIGAAL